VFKIALAQINPCVGDLEGNCAMIISNIARAKAKGADIVIFPELAVCGYPPEDLLMKRHFIQKNIECVKKIAVACRDILVFVGFVDSDGKNIYNACAVIADKKILKAYRKINLPNYGVFDEKRYFTSGDKMFFGVYKGKKYTVSICEDIWAESFVKSLKGRKLDFVVNLSASPFHLGKLQLREKILRSAALKAAAPVFYANLVGGQDELVFDGTSMVVSAKGKVLARAASFKEDLLVVDYETAAGGGCNAIISRNEQIFGALTLGLSDYVDKNGFKKVLVGVSGGIDSAAVVTLAVKALGPERVLGVMLPSRFTSQGTASDGETICRNLGIKYYTISIEDIFETFLRTLTPVFSGLEPDITEENLQARIRGAILMAISNKFGALVLNTGNKSEVSCGYCTLYGDMIGGFAVLKDLTKDMVYAFSRHLNAIMNGPIPLSVIKRAPSAELKDNQKDSDSLPEYKILDPLVRMYVEKDYSLEEMVEAGYDRNSVKKVIALIDFSEYKRRQAPMGVKITARAFGKDRRMPVTNKFRG
jgi:NAD+ synthase (glutamine-hydrolysing)